MCVREREGGGEIRDERELERGLGQECSHRRKTDSEEMDNVGDIKPIE